jgi:hypothetical protein
MLPNKIFAQHLFLYGRGYCGRVERVQRLTEMDLTDDNNCMTATVANQNNDYARLLLQTTSTPRISSNKQDYPEL